MRGVHIRCFFTFKICDKTYLSLSWFWIGFGFGFGDGFLVFYATNEFIMVPKVFSRNFESK